MHNPANQQVNTQLLLTASLAVGVEVTGMLMQGLSGRGASGKDLPPAGGWVAVVLIGSSLGHKHTHTHTVCNYADFSCRPRASSQGWQALTENSVIGMTLNLHTHTHSSSPALDRLSNYQTPAAHLLMCMTVSKRQPHLRRNQIDGASVNACVWALTRGGDVKWFVIWHALLE